ncbi:MAG: LacI family DNA-binding transcriptional regulator, partial [Opitutaceae bacterium]
MSKPVSLRDVAVRAGVHPTTVSMALKSHPRIPPATRERIAKIAAELDYRPNPLVAALMHYRRARRQLVVQATLAWVTDYPTRDGWKDPDMEWAYRAAADRAHELGFKLDPHWAAEPGISPARFRQILAARGITGVIVSRLPHGVTDLATDVAGLSAVGFGVTLQTPELHRVAYNHFDVVRHAVD